MRLLKRYLCLFFLLPVLLAGQVRDIAIDLKAEESCEQADETCGDEVTGARAERPVKDESRAQREREQGHRRSHPDRRRD
jgi:hypothetical protein